MLITSKDYTATQHDIGAAEENQQAAKQLHEEQPERKSPPRHSEYRPFMC